MPLIIRSFLQVDFVHTQVRFSVRHMMISTVRRQFERFHIDTHIDEDEINQIHDSNVLTEEDVLNSSLEVQIEAASINTRDPKRDEHLRSADFFTPPIIHTSRSRRSAVKE